MCSCFVGPGSRRKGVEGRYGFVSSVDNSDICGGSDDEEEREQDEEEEENSPTPFLAAGRATILPYISNYRRRTKILRLAFIADRFPDDSERLLRIKLEALRTAYDWAKKGKSVVLFTEIVERIRGRLGPNYVMDEKWCNEVNSRKQEMESVLEKWAEECEECCAKGSVSANSARIALSYVGNFYYAHSEIRKAYSYYERSHSFCKTAKEYSQMLSRVMVVAAEMRDFQLLGGIAEGALKIANLNPITIQSLRSSLGLAHFMARRYRDAALQFLGISKELGNRFSEVMAAHDIAIYGGLSALATFEPTELKSLVLDNENFEFYLDSATEVKGLINDFYSRRYSSCFKRFYNIKRWLLIDMYFVGHYEALYAQIRNKALILYAEPFTTLSLQRVAAVFGTTIEAVEKDLSDLILTNQLQAHIDPTNKLLHLPKV